MLTEIMLRVRTYVHVKLMCKITGIFEKSVDTDKMIVCRNVYLLQIITECINISQ